MTAAALMAAAAAGAPAQAATVGRDFEPSENTSCGSGGSWYQSPAVQDYGIPEAGVLTSWRLRGAIQTTGFKFKVGRGATDILTVGETPANQAGSLIEAPARISVRAGDRIGFYANSFNVGCGQGQVASQQRTADDPPGTSSSGYQSLDFLRFGLSAVVEPDADGDGYGDESQDSCPALASVHDSACPSPPGALTPPIAIVGGPSDLDAPVIARSKLSASVFAVDSKARASTARKGTRLSFQLSEAATVVFVTEQRVEGRWRKIRIFGKRFNGGRNTLNYSGMIKPRGKRRALKPGRYRLRMRPSDKAGNRGVVTTVGFSITK